MDYPRISLEAARVNAGLKQKEAASRLGISPLTLRNYESGKTSPSMDMVVKIEQLYHFPAQYIFFCRN